MENTMLEDEESLLGGTRVIRTSKKKNTSSFDIKLVSFFTIGFLTTIYVIAELAAAIYLQSLVLLSDGFHNLSDVISLGIAYWARKATKRASTDEMSYGWARTEILGGLTNGCFLLSLVVYVMLESIPKIINPTPLVEGGSLLFIIISASGLTVNIVGTIVFSLTGQAHAHSHSHGGHSHGHDHGHKDDKKKKEKIKPALSFNVLELESPSQSPKSEEHKEKKEKKGHGHAHEHGHEEKKEKKEKGHGHSHGHGHEEKKEKKEKGHGHAHEHGHEEKKEKKEKKGHGHSHEHKEEKKPKRDENMHAVFLHFLGDAISSLMVLGAGLLIHFFNSGKWTNYIDPISSLIISCLILYTTIPLVKRCSMILLQSTGDIDVKQLRKKLTKLEGLVSVHDLHIWQLVDGMTIASVHIAIEEGVDFNTIVTQVKKIFHKAGVHSSSIQPEFVPRNVKAGAFCGQNCVKECHEDWCCKKSVDNLKELEDQYSIRTEL